MNRHPRGYWSDSFPLCHNWNSPGFFCLFVCLGVCFVLFLFVCLFVFNGSALLLRKQQLAAEYNWKQVLRHHFTEWQHWHRAEILKRELAITKEETRKKMNELLKAALLGKLSATVSSSSNLLEATAMEDPSRNEEASCFSCA